MTIKLLYDDIIYQLQQAGGISTYWKEITARIAKNEIFNVSFTKGSRLTRYLPVFSQVNIFHSSYYRLNLSPQTKNVITVYDFLYELGFLKTVGSSINIFQRKIAIKQADAIICISENTKKDLLSFYPELSDHPHIYVVNLAASFTRENPENLKLSKRLAEIADTIKRSILFIGKRVKYKNFHNTLRGFSLSSLPKQDYTLLCIGSTLSEEEEQLINRLEIKENVLVVEKATTEELQYLYQNAAGLIYPSLYEGFGLPPLEAMSCGCPVIVSNSSSIPEVVADSGVLLESTNPECISSALEQLLDDRIRQNYIAKGLRRSQLFSWDRAAEEHLHIYNSLLD